VEGKVNAQSTKSGGSIRRYHGFFGYPWDRSLNNNGLAECWHWAAAYNFGPMSRVPLVNSIF
jgi:hypothetical protein